MGLLFAPLEVTGCSELSDGLSEVQESLQKLYNFLSGLKKMDSELARYSDEFKSGGLNRTGHYSAVTWEDLENILKKRGDATHIISTGKQGFPSSNAPPDSKSIIRLQKRLSSLGNDLQRISFLSHGDFLSWFETSIETQEQAGWDPCELEDEPSKTRVLPRGKKSQPISHSRGPQFYSPRKTRSSGVSASIRSSMGSNVSKGSRKTFEESQKTHKKTHRKTHKKSTEALQALERGNAQG
ncbi:hypothetical protein PIIN_11125 [Serendipita indica DSM 11827]|uniref:Uncharacterized protein n=1 Tax=Serendipita indica (strain DSM 11827) TaxID=1109443 RepID=G4U0P9_SERID|nr:hypothetical protein PIIN_11125 [Serendipita indica DSM 11827]